MANLPQLFLSAHPPVAISHLRGRQIETQKQHDFTIGMRKRFFLVWTNSDAGRQWIRNRLFPHSPETNPDSFVMGPIPIEKRNVVRVIERIHSAGLSVGFERDEQWAAKGGAA
jgi:hypothetical protein